MIFRWSIQLGPRWSHHYSALKSTWRVQCPEAVLGAVHRQPFLDVQTGVQAVVEAEGPADVSCSNQEICSFPSCHIQVTSEKAAYDAGEYHLSQHRRQCVPLLSSSEGL